MGYIPLPADVLFTRNEKSWIGPAIRWATRGNGEPPTYTNHVAGVGVGRHRVIEALWTVEESDVDLWQALNPVFQAWRIPKLPMVTRNIVAVEASQYLGRSYGWWKLGAHLGDGLLSKLFGKNVYLFRPAMFMKNYPICSWVWAYAYSKIGVRFDCNPDCADPDTMHDYVSSSPEWVKVF